MKKKFKISSSVTSASAYGSNCEYNKNIFQLWSMMKGWGYEEDIVTCHTFHVLCGPTQLPSHCQSMPGLPAYFAVHCYHGIIPCKKNRLVLPMNGRRVNVKGMTCHNIFFISSAFHHQSKLEDILIIFTIEAIVRCWCYWRRNFKFLLHFLTDIVPE